MRKDKKLGKELFEISRDSAKSQTTKREQFCSAEGQKVSDLPEQL
jgi:hypothetical protein